MILYDMYKTLILDHFIIGEKPVNLFCIQICCKRLIPINLISDIYPEVFARSYKVYMK